MVRVQLKALLNKLNRHIKQALEGAAGLCVQRSHYEVSIEHLLLKLTDDEKGDVQEILRHYEIEPAEFIKSLHRAVESLRTGNPGKPVFARSMIEMLQEAWLISSVEFGAGHLRSGAIMLTIAMNPGRTNLEDFTDVFDKISAEDLRKNFADIVIGTSEDEEAAAAALGGTPDQPQPGRPSAHGRDPDSSLARFTIDFTAEARAGRIDPVFERDREIRQVIDILARRRKNNPIIVGEPGTGKTALVEGLALRIVEGDVPEILHGVDLLSLDMGLLQAGAGMKGEFENRLKSVLNEVKSSAKPIVLFIDEAHTMIGAGGTAGGSDAANLLKPALARGELRTVAATTWSEYKKYFERDAALSRRFQVVKCDEPSEDAAIAMLRGLREKYEASHGVRVRDDSLVTAAQMSNRYISGRLLPDKAVDLLDTAAARVRVSLTAKPVSLDDAERKIITIDREIESLQRDLNSGNSVEDGRIDELKQQKMDLHELSVKIKEQWLREKEFTDRIVEITRTLDKDERARSEAEDKAVGLTKPEGDKKSEGSDDGEKTEVSDKSDAGTNDPGKADEPVDRAALEAELKEKIAALESAQGVDPLLHIDVNPEIVAKVVADWTGIPIGSMVRDEARTILELEDNLRERIKGQDHGVASVAKGLRAAKAGVSNPDTPMGVFLFVGPSGVGKTETALAVADQLFGGERFMVTINMSEFQEKHTVSRLVGSPPGYVGYGEGGVLTEAVRQRPYSVVLLDEVEKADLDVMNIFYQVFDKGMLADGEGRIIDFKNTVVFLTSNLATEEIMAATQGPTPISPGDLASHIRPILSKHFKPALLARMTVVPFFPLRGDSMKGIVSLKLDRLGKRLESSHKMGFTYDDAIVDQISERCTEVETGARNIDHIINGTLLPRISTSILEQLSDEAMPDVLHLSLDENGDFELAFSFNGDGNGAAGAPDPAAEEVPAET